MTMEPVTTRVAGTGFPVALAVGDLVFIQVSAPPFRWVGRSTGSWTNHVGVVIDASIPDPVIAESRIPLSGTTRLSQFLQRSADARVAVTRLKSPLTETQQADLERAARRRLGILYDTGFNLHSRRQFCSRFVREVIAEATGESIAEVETFRELLNRQPGTPLWFWRLWYFGRIPWQRETVSPASVLGSLTLVSIFDGTAPAAALRSLRFA